VARETARRNGVASRLRLYCAPGLRHPLAARPSSFDLILANILARPLAQLSPALAGALSAKGKLVASGLLEADVATALSAFARQGLHLERRYLIEGWATLILG
jgi:ribosomal protein L11 methyltransferase